MSGAAPVVYLLHGDDEFAIAQFIDELETKLGDPATAVMNVMHLDGRTYDLDGLLSIAGAMPFLAKRRIVILVHPLARLTSPAARQKFLGQLEKIPPTTAMVLVEHNLLTDERDRRKGKLHWLEEWAVQAGERVFLKAFRLPQGAAMAQWIQERARRDGGQITMQGAELLASLVAGDTRLADQEVQKLLAYVNYQRPVDFEDVENLTADYGQGDIFAMVDALGNMDGRTAMRTLQRLLEHQEPLYVFGMIVRQFRLLLLTREVIERGGGKEQVMREVGMHPYVADKLLTQARRFRLPDLEGDYHRLLDIDEAIKTGQMPGELALETFVADFTSAPAQPRTSR